VKDNDLISKYAAPPRNERNSRAEQASDGNAVAESYVAMLDLILSDGNHVALPYTTLLKIEFNPSSEIRMRFPMDDVVIKGTRLESLYKALTQHRVPSIKAAGERSGEWRDDEQQAVITEIRCTSTE